MVGNRIPCIVGLGAIVPLGDRRQRNNYTRAFLLRPSAGKYLFERRRDRSGRKRVGHPSFAPDRVADVDRLEGKFGAPNGEIGSNFDVMGLYLNNIRVVFYLH